MTQYPHNFSIFLNSLLSSKEIRLDQSNEKNKTVQITECSIFNNSKMIIPLELINAKPSIGKRLDAQWLLFGLLSLLAAGLFLTMAISQQFTIPYYLSAGFVLSALFSVYAANKQGNTSYTYQCRETRSTLFTLTENDLNSPNISEFVTMLNHLISQSINTEIEAAKLTKNDLNISKLSSVNLKQTNDLQIYYQYLEFLYEEGIINRGLLEELEQRAYNKVNGIIDPRPLAKVIPLPLSR